jgi:hypothetical protein
MSAPSTHTRCVLLIIVDSEGQMAEFLHGAIKRGALDVDNVCLFQQNLEQSNATPEELIELASELARNPPPGREPVELRLDAATLRAVHNDRGARVSGKAPGLVDVLLDLAASDEHGPVRIDKPELAEALALMLLRELDAARGDEETIEEIRRRRPIVRFVLDRLVPVINVPRPAGTD